MIGPLLALLAGVLFALGLGLGGMTRPDKVLGFLDVRHGWDPSLAFVMLGALLVYGVALRVARGRPGPLLGGSFQLPTRTDIDARLVGGAALFGLGWGLAGYCPGPAVVGLASGAIPVLVFVGAMAAGMAGVTAWEARGGQGRGSIAGTATDSPGPGGRQGTSPPSTGTNQR